MSLQGYFSMLLTASVLGAVCAAFAGGAFEKYLRYLSALICILLLVSPFRSLELFPARSQQSSLPEESAVSGRTLAELAGELAEPEIRAQIAAALSEQTGITADDVRIDIDWTEEEPVIRAVRLILSPADAGRAEEAAAWVEAAYGVPGYAS